jgi:hypothetical protein
MNEEKISNYFKLLKEKELIGPTYAFIGDDFSLVKDVIKIISCRQAEAFCGRCWDCEAIAEDKHPDVCLIAPQNLTITIENIREAQRFLSLKGFRLKKKIVLVKEAQSLGLEAANAFLKTLEEPPKNSFIAISTSKLEGLLPTIVSRCRKIFLPFQEKENPSVNLSLISSFLRGERIAFKDRSDFASFLWAFALLFRDYLIYEATHQNKELLKSSDYEIILQSSVRKRPYTLEELEGILKETLRIYSVYNSINENLALNLLRMKL